MAISIDTVYQRVLALANKEQRGYITPQEFNLLAGKAQLDIFNQYFHDYKTAILSPGNQTRSSDDAGLVRDKITEHRVIGSNLHVDASGNAGLPSSVHWLESVYKKSYTNRVVQIDINAANLSSYSAVRLMCYGPVSPGANPTQGTFDVLFDSQSISSSDSYNTVIAFISDTSTSTQVASKVAFLLNSESSFHTASSSGSVVTVTYTQEIDWTTTEAVNVLDTATTTTVLNAGSSDGTFDTYEEVDVLDYRYIKSNKKLNPTTSSRGIFHRYDFGNGLSVSPNPGATILKFDYIKKPSNPGWGYIVVGEKALHNPSSSTDFELHPAEESNLTNKILELAGIVINKPGLSEVILRNQAVKEAKENR